MLRTLALLLALAAPAAAQTDACRTAGTRLDGRAFRLTIVPSDGSPEIKLLLRYEGCRTVDIEPMLGGPTAPTARRTYGAAGTSWWMALHTEVGADESELYVYYAAPGETRPYPVAFFHPAPTFLVQAEIVDWGTTTFMNETPRFKFSARAYTQ